MNRGDLSFLPVYDMNVYIQGFVFKHSMNAMLLSLDPKFA